MERFEVRQHSQMSQFEKRTQFERENRRRDNIASLAFVLIAIAIAIALAVVTSGCSTYKAISNPVTSIDASNVAPLWDKVLERHDLYVIADQSLTQVERESYLVSSQLIRDVLAEAMAKSAIPPPPSPPEDSP